MPLPFTASIEDVKNWVDEEEITAWLLAFDMIELPEKEPEKESMDV